MYYMHISLCSPRGLRTTSESNPEDKTDGSQTLLSSVVNAPRNTITIVYASATRKLRGNTYCNRLIIGWLILTTPDKHWSGCFVCLKRLYRGGIYPRGGKFVKQLWESPSTDAEKCVSVQRRGICALEKWRLGRRHEGRSCM
jgi:hypothetical protein